MGAIRPTYAVRQFIDVTIAAWMCGATRRVVALATLDFGPLQEIANGAYEYFIARLREASPPREGV